MSALALDSADLCRMLGQVSAALGAHSEEIRELDAKVGDGDLGITVDLIGKALLEFAGSTSETDVGRLLMQCGVAVQ